MMKAEDTVISWERIRMILQEQDKKEQRDNMFRLEAIAEAQAEISFKAGIKEVGISLLVKEEEGMCARAKQEGIKEVIEGYRKIRACTHIPGYHNLADCSRCEEAKLKEWGVNNG